MERESLGIAEVMKDALKNKKRTARQLAKMVVQEIWAQVHQHDTQEHHNLNPLERVAHTTLRLEGPCRKNARRHARADFAGTIEILLHQFEGAEEVNGKKIKEILISGELQKMVAKAALQLLSLGIEKKGLHELAHNLHNEPNAFQLFHNPVRLALIDRGIINANPRTPMTRHKEQASALWTGHKTGPKYQKNGSGETNIYVEIQPDGSVTPILQGNRIISAIADEIIVVNNETLGFYSEPVLPDKQTTGFMVEEYFSMPNTIGDFKSLRPIAVANFVRWNGYQIEGTKGSTVVCIRTKKEQPDDSKEEPEEPLSFASNGKIFSINNTILVIEKDTIHVLSQSGKTSMPTKVGRIIGVRKNGTAEQALYLVIQGENKKIIIGETGADIVSVESEEEQFFEETK